MKKKAEAEKASAALKVGLWVDYRVKTERWTGGIKAEVGKKQSVVKDGIKTEVGERQVVGNSAKGRRAKR
ncbi:MAG: hypothetical protein ILP02_05105 [Clostridia bacterium]|nr:hypothetical protein [Clostridia bacterium]